MGPQVPLRRALRKHSCRGGVADQASVGQGWAVRELVLAVVLVMAPGCQCFTPVSEDGGVTPNVDAGARDAGLVDAGPQCRTHDDCVGDAGSGLNWCSGSAWTCAFGTCVKDCAPGLTCDRLDAGCIGCSGEVACQSACPQWSRLVVERSTCNVGFVALPLSPMPGETCRWQVSGEDGGVMGTLTLYGYQFLEAELPEFGGVCVGPQLPTGALRFSLGCAQCLFSVMPEP